MNTEEEGLCFGLRTFRAYTTQPNRNRLQLKKGAARGELERVGWGPKTTPAMQALSLLHMHKNRARHRTHHAPDPDLVHCVSCEEEEKALWGKKAQPQGDHNHNPTTSAVDTPSTGRAT